MLSHQFKLHGHNTGVFEVVLAPIVEISVELDSQKLLKTLYQLPGIKAQERVTSKNSME